MIKTTDMTVGKPIKLILQFALPLIITNLGQQLYMIVDAAIVGRGVGVKALAAVGSADWIIWLFLWTVCVLTQGFATFVSRYFGEKNFTELNRTIAMSTVLSVAFALVLTLAGVFTAKPLLLLLDTPQDIIDSAAIYLITMIAGTVVVTLYNLAAAILRALGDSKTPLVAMIIAAVLNIGLDLLFVVVLKLGVFGAAIASVISQLFSFFYCLVQIKNISCIFLPREMWQLDFTRIKELFFFGFPLALQYIVISLGGVILQSTINLQGSFFVAGYTAVNKLYGLLECSAISLGSAFSTYFAQNFGAGRNDRVLSGVRASFLLSVIAAAVVALLTMIFEKNLLQFFLDPSMEGGFEAMQTGKNYLVLMCINMPVLYLIYVYRHILQAVGNSLWSMLSGFAEFIIRVSMGKFLFLILGVNTLYYIEPAAWLGALVTVMIPYYILRKKYLGNANDNI
ncbi:MAG: MATE family efflux transporter [Oscillospiraceae bacterium]|nr:MATE family efflux transporter [Oscillospiraceae bacterium]